MNCEDELMNELTQQELPASSVGLEESEEMNVGGAGRRGRDQ